MSTMCFGTLRVTIRRAVVTALVCIGLALGIAVRADATPVVLTFEGIGDQAYVDQFYNGGTDSNGNSGADYGIEFGPAAIGMIDTVAGGGGQWTNEPSPATVLFFVSPWLGGAAINVATGFDTTFSLFYSSIAAHLPLSIFIYGGLDASGDVLGTLTLPPNADGCAGCTWTEISVGFSGIAHSVDFSGSNGTVGFDDMTFNLATPVIPPPVAVPEPGTLGTMAVGLVLLVTLYRRRRLS